MHCQRCAYRGVCLAAVVLGLVFVAAITARADDIADAPANPPATAPAATVPPAPAPAGASAEVSAAAAAAAPAPADRDGAPRQPAAAIPPGGGTAPSTTPGPAPADNARKALDDLAADFNMLFTRRKIALLVDTDRFHQRQVFQGGFVKNADGDWEQKCSVETLKDRGIVDGSHMDGVQRLTIEDGNMVTYVSYQGTKGGETYGPAAVERVGAGIRFREISALFPGAWESTEFFCSPDGTLGSVRCWNGRPSDRWLEVELSDEDKKAPAASLAPAESAAEADPFATSETPAAAAAAEAEADPFATSETPAAAEPAPAKNAPAKTEAELFGE